MNAKDVDRFFTRLSRAYPHPARVWILGGAAALLMGGTRPTMDIDFEVKLDASGEKPWNDFTAAIDTVQAETGIQAQYSECTDRWSSITFLDFREHAKSFKSYGTIKVFLFSPLHWSIGKISRFLQQDCDDMLAVFSHTQPDPCELAQTWNQALKKSPRSPEVFLARKNMQHFLKEYGKKVWGKSFPEEKITKIWES